MRRARSRSVDLHEVDPGGRSTHRALARTPSPPVLHLQRAVGNRATTQLLQFGGDVVVHRKADPEMVASQARDERQPPRELDPEAARAVGAYVLKQYGYERLIELGLQFGVLEPAGDGRSVDRRVQPDRPANAVGPAVSVHREAGAATFGAVFGRWAVAAGVASQVDSPAPGPGDVVAIGILAVGLVVAGATILMSKGGRKNVEDTGIRAEVEQMIEAAKQAGRVLTICGALDLLMKAAKAAGDKAKMQKIKATQKFHGCRHSGGGG